jgi:ribosomal protein L34E
MVQRLTYRRRHSFNTSSNLVKVVKTPGGKLKYQYRSKLAKGPACGDCGCVIQGVRSHHIIGPYDHHLTWKKKKNQNDQT